MDAKIKSLIAKEKERQEKTINLIASENYVSDSVLFALGSVFTNKYAEGYVGARYYAGNAVVDDLEKYVESLALKTFHRSERKWSVNVQPYSGSPANLAVFLALIPKNEKIMAMDLRSGGHLTHGSKISITGKFWKQVPYEVNKKTEKINYNELLKIAKKEKPNIIIAGGSAYSRIIDFKKFRKIADTVNAIFMVDMSHFAGLVAGKAYPSPFPYADIVTTTTHKTLRGPRGAMIFSRNEFSEKINKAVFPGLQGGPHMNTIAAIGVVLCEAQKPSFQKYAHNVVVNAQTLSAELQKLGWRIVSDGTDSHLFLIDTMTKNISGKTASDKLELAGIIVNKNMIPFDTRKPNDPSGVRIGTAAITTRGMKTKEIKILAEKINKVLS
jgi:glycine hydroxymethyltransferase